MHVSSVMIVTQKMFGYCGRLRAFSLFVNRSAMFVEAVFKSTIGFSYVLFVTVVTLWDLVGVSKTQTSDLRPRKLRPRNFRPRKLRPRKLRPRNFRPRKLKPRKLRPRNFRKMIKIVNAVLQATRMNIFIYDNYHD